MEAADAQPSELDLSSVLPEDAPEGHEAWTKVRFNSQHKWPLANFTFNKERFQTTLGACLTEHATLVVSRACYVRLASGDSLASVQQFRKECYDRIKEFKNQSEGKTSRPSRTRSAAALAASPPAADGATVSSGPPGVAVAGSPPADSAPQPLKRRASGIAPAQADGAAGVQEAAVPEPELPQPGADAPPGHEAWYNPKGPDAKGVVVLNMVREGEKIRFQTTVGRCGGDKEEAKRIARLCYMKFQEGAGKEAVTRFRDALYDRIPNSNAPPAKKPRPDAPAGAAGGGQNGARRPQLTQQSIEAAKRRLQAEGRLDGALIVRGRSEEKKNASINGVYSLLPGGHDGYVAYKKESGEAPRYLYFWRSKNRWKIDNKLPTEKSGFAYLKVDNVRTPADAGPEHQWHVCDRKGEGYSKDPGVRVEEIRIAGASSSASSRPAAAAEASQATQDATSTSDSDSSGEESDASSGADASPGAAGTQASSTGAQALRSVRIKACAKMLVNSGFRCPRTFKRLQDLPNRAG